MPGYLDHAATTPIRPVAAEAMVGARGVVGNPSSIHGAGRRARARLEEARESLAAHLDADPTEVVWTSGGTEADNLAIVGAWRARRDGRDRLVVSAVEHHAVLDAVDHLVTHEGARVTWVAPEADGRVSPDAVRAALDEDVALVSVLWSGNEVGVVNDLATVTDLAHERGIPVHSDAVAAFGHTPLSFRLSGVDLLSVTAHKLGGPVGTGALVARRDARLAPTTYGGGQERRLRSGTLDVAGALGFAAAAQEACSTLTQEAARLVGLRDRLLAGALAADLGISVTGSWTLGDDLARMPGNAHLFVPDADVDALLSLLDLAGLEVAAGSACTAGVARFSHVLTAMGYALGSGAPLRATLGWTSTAAEVDAFLEALPGAVEGARRAWSAR